MGPLIYAGSASQRLGCAIARRLGAPLAGPVVERFPDGELHVQIKEPVRGGDVYLIQSTSSPIETHLLELLLMTDACRRAGAARLTAVLPYFGYARQDRRRSGQEAIAARVVANLIEAAGVDRVVALDLHSPSIEGFFQLPVEQLTSVPLLARELRQYVPANGVIVAPDLGASKLADRYSQLLGLPVAVVQKTRLRPDEVQALRLTGDVRDRTPIIVDDILSTGGTIEAAALLLRESVLSHLAELDGSDPAELRRARRAKFRAMGVLASV